MIGRSIDKQEIGKLGTMPLCTVVTHRPTLAYGSRERGELKSLLKLLSDRSNVPCSFNSYFSRNSWISLAWLRIFIMVWKSNTIHKHLFPEHVGFYLLVRLHMQWVICIITPKNDIKNWFHKIRWFKIWVIFWLLKVFLLWCKLT